jgi:murein DD-endopeptidase MepM/ murein hydrolase activator NlpD
MRQTAFWSSYGRCAYGFLAVAGAALAVSGCSSSSRFDFPSFSLTDSSDSSNADLTETSSVPIPPESVYNSGGSQPGAQIARSSLPPPASYTPRPTANYSPAPSARLKSQQVNYGAQGEPRAESAVMGGAASGHHVKVAKGDTLSVLSRRYGVPVERIMSANNLADGRLHIGQDLIIPGTGSKGVEAVASSPPESTYKVQKGDTPHVIADKLGVDEKALLARNKLRADNLQIGQVLVIPRKGAAPVVAAKGTKLATPKATPDVHVVKTTTIPAPGGTSLAEEESQPGGKATEAKPAKPAKPDKSAKPDKKPEASANDVAASPEITGEGSPRVASNDQLPAPDPMSGNSFRWPVKGRVISEFGTKPDGGHNDGIDVAVPQGTSVKAAENGVVAYAGNELKGYGNLILIRHANNWVSAYAHNDEILVKRGDKVRRGQIIAKAGATGSVTQPQVHFELRKGSRPVDPTKFMSDQAASAD